MSCGWPMRPSGVCASTCLRRSLSAMPAAWTPSVSTMPGLIEFTRIFRGPNSAGIDRTLCRAVNRAVRDPRRRDHRTDVDDAPAGRAEQLHRLAGREDQAEHV